MDRPKVQAMLAELAEDSANVIVTHHAQERMDERGITWRQVVRCLAKGTITEGPAPDLKGGWKLTVEAISAGEPLAVVAAVTEDHQGNKAIVVTAYHPGQ